VIHGTGIIRLALGTQTLFIFAELFDGIVQGVLLAGAPPRDLGMAIGGSERAALAVRCAGQVILDSYLIKGVVK